jgi:NAD(P)-dependent dehydrogenase (short-subunit alcohol dehydrogenase family)
VRAVLVTGASRGIGEACVRMLDEKGFRVFGGVRDAAAGTRLARHCSDRFEFVHLDVTDPQSIRTAADTITQSLGAAGLHGLVNNAGIAVAGPLEFLPIDALRQQLEVNVIGPIAVTQALLPALRSARGRIVNIGSIAGRSALPFTGAYSASKYAVEALSDALRLELRPWDIKVSVVEPGSVATDIWETSSRSAAAMMASVPASALELYGRLLEGIRRGAAASAARGLSPDVVARAVLHALTAKRPRRRYLIGNDARSRILLEHLPTRVRDAVLARIIEKL